MTMVRVAAIADLHYTKTSAGAFQPLFTSIKESADLLLIAGDLTDYGLPEEAQVLARDLSALRIPIVAVLGNHDVESGRETEVRQVLAESGVVVLDGDAREVAGVGIAGVKGFGGGFGNRALAPWGETVVKQFVREAVEEALKLEKALARLRTETDRGLDALLAGPADRGGRAARNLPVSRLEPSRGADQSLPCVVRISRPRPPRPDRRRDGRTRSGLQRLDAAADARLSRIGRRSASSSWRTSSRPPPRQATPPAEHARESRDVLRRRPAQLSCSSIPFLVGGAFAFARHVGIERPTKDLDLFLKPGDVRRALRLLQGRGYRSRCRFPTGWPRSIAAIRSST